MKHIFRFVSFVALALSGTNSFAEVCSPMWDSAKLPVARNMETVEFKHPMWDGRPPFSGMRANFICGWKEQGDDHVALAFQNVSVMQALECRSDSTYILKVIVTPEEMAAYNANSLRCRDKLTIWPTNVFNEAEGQTVGIDGKKFYMFSGWKYIYEGRLGETGLTKDGSGQKTAK